MLLVVIYLKVFLIMGNNFYVGEIFHSKKYTKPSRIEKPILYSEDSFIYIDLLNQNGISFCYPTVQYRIEH